MRVRYQEGRNGFKELRKMLGMTQRDMAEVFRVSPGCYAMWESGRRSIPGPAYVVAELIVRDLSTVRFPLKKRMPLRELAVLPIEFAKAVVVKDEAEREARLNRVASRPVRSR